MNDRPQLVLPPEQQLQQVAGFSYSELKDFSKAQLKQIAGVSTDHITREQLIARIQHGSASTTHAQAQAPNLQSGH